MPCTLTGKTGMNKREATDPTRFPKRTPRKAIIPISITRDVLSWEELSPIALNTPKWIERSRKVKMAYIRIAMIARIVELIKPTESKPKAPWRFENKVLKRSSGISRFAHCYSIRLTRSEIIANDAVGDVFNSS